MYSRLISILLTFCFATYGNDCKNITKPVGKKGWKLAYHMGNYAYLSRYPFRLLQAKIYGKYADEIFSEYFYEGVKRGLLTEEKSHQTLSGLNQLADKEIVEIRTFFKRLQDGVGDRLDEANEFDNVIRGILEENIPNNYPLKSELVQEFVRLGRFEARDAIKISKQMKELTPLLESYDDIDKLIELLLIVDSYKSFEKSAALSEFANIYKSLDDEGVKLSSIGIKAKKKYLKIIKKTERFKKERYSFHRDNARAASESTYFRKNYLQCSARSFSNDRSGGQRKTVLTIYLTAIMAHLFGYAINDNFSKEHGVAKYFMELVLGLLYVHTSKPIFVGDTLSGSQKLFVGLIFNLVYNVADSFAYKQLFGENFASSQTNLPIEIKEIDKILKNIRKFEEIDKIFKRIDQAQDYEAEIAKILDEYNYQGPKIDEAFDRFTKVLSVQHEYRKKHFKEGRETLNIFGLEVNNWFLNGDPDKDRLEDNNAYTGFSTIKSIIFIMLVNRLFCHGIKIGPYIIGGQNNIAKAAALSAFILIFEKAGSAWFFYFQRNKLIGQ